MTSEYTTNTLRTAEDEIGEWIHQPGADLRVEEDTASLQMDVDYSYIRRIYTKDLWKDENRLNGTASINWQALEERLDFFLNNTRTESTQRALQTATQDNRQTVATTEAGGRLLFQPRTGDELQLEYLYRDVHTTRTETDSQRHNGTLRYSLGLSPNRSLLTTLTYSDINYEGPFPDAEYAIASVGYSQTSGDFDLDLTFGYNWYDRVGRGSTSDPTYQAAINWRATGNVSFSLKGSRLITDQGSGLASGSSASENTGINAAFEETTGSLGYNHVVGPNSWDLEGYWTRQEYAEDVPLSNTRVGGRFNFSRSLTRTTNLNAFVDVSNRDFKDELDDQDEIRAGLRIDRRLGRSLSLNLGVRYEKRDAATTVSYDEWIGSIQLYWTFWGAQR